MFVCGYFIDVLIWATTPNHPTPIINHLSVVEPLTRSNFMKWKHDPKLALSLMDIDKCLLEEKPFVSVGENTQGVKTKLKKWESRPS